MECCKIITKGDDPYDKHISLFLAKHFDINKVNLTSEDVVDIISSEIMGTKQTRFGPKPPVEIQVEIRKVIRHWLEKSLPIPMVVPWGSEKPNGSSVDVAELGALKTLSCLNQRVRQHYSPGLIFNIRIEDASAPHLFHDREDDARREARRYTDDLVNLIKMISFETFINPIVESTLIDEDTFNNLADKILPYMMIYVRNILEGNDIGIEYTELQQLGWKGSINPRTLSYYMDRFNKTYNGYSSQFKMEKIARYFSGSLARASLKLRGDNPEWDGMFAELSFAPNPPGVEYRFGRRIIYRTLPKRFTSVNIPPWRAKGYLSINNEGEITPKLTSFNDDDLELTTKTVTLRNGDSEVEISTDYVEE